MQTSEIDSFITIRQNLYDDYEKETMKDKKDRNEIIKKLTNVVNFDNLLIIDAQRKIKYLDSTLEATQYNYNDLREKYSNFEPTIKNFKKFTLLLYCSIGAETLLLLIFIIMLYTSKSKLKKTRNSLSHVKQSLENSEIERNLLQKQLDLTNQLIEKFTAGNMYRAVPNRYAADASDTTEAPKKNKNFPPHPDKFELNLVQLEKLSQLRKNNILTEEEFLKIKQKILENL